MSDGPHKSLQLRKPWKELAKRGDQAIYDLEQVAEAASSALASDFVNEVKWALLDSLKAIFTGRNNSLMSPEIALQELRDCLSVAAGSVFGMSAVRCGVQLINEGRFGLDAFHEALGLAAKQRGDANVRSIEEHYLRKEGQRRSDHVSRRLQTAISSFSEEKLGAKLAMARDAGTQRLVKKTGINQGVRL